MLPPVGVEPVWVWEGVLVAMQAIGLRRDRRAPGDELTRELGAPSGYNPGQAARKRVVEAQSFVDAPVEVGHVSQVIIPKVFGGARQLLEEFRLDVWELADGPDEVDHGVGRGIAAAHNEDLRIVADLDWRPGVLGAGRVKPGEDGWLGILALILDALGVAVQRDLGVVEGPVLDLGGVLEDGDGEIQGEPGYGREHGAQAADETQADKVID